MNDSLEQFRDLAWRALESPADTTLRAQLAEQLSAHPEWVAEWRGIRENHALAREAAHAATDRAQADRTEQIPVDRLAALLRRQDKTAFAQDNTGHSTQSEAGQAERRRLRAHRWRWLGLVAGIALVASTALWIGRSRAQDAETFDVTPWIARASPGLAHALTAPLATVVTNAHLPTLRSDTPLLLRSPLLSTRAGEVTIAWTGSETASLMILAAGKPVWTAANTRSPAHTTALAADRTYELVLTDANGTTVRELFATVAAAAHEESGMTAILTALTAEPARLGDAVLAWHALPDSTRHSQTGVRLGLWLGVEARQPDLLDEAHAAQQRLR